MSITARVGDRVGDSESDDSETAIVVGISNKKSGEYEIKSMDQTVQDLNPKYGSEERVILVSFESHLEKVIPNWAFLNGQELTQKVMNHDVNKYAYPESRLFYINHGFIDGVTIRISGVENPINQDSGAYAYTIESDDEIIHSESKIVSYGGSYVGKNTSIYEGLISALKWIRSNKNDIGILIRTEESIVVKQMTGEYDIQDSGNEMLFYEIMSIISNFPYHVVHLEQKYNLEKLNKKAREIYKNSKIFN